MSTQRSMLQIGAAAFGVVFVLVALIGFIQGDTVLGIFEVDTVHNLIHLASGVVALAAASSAASSRAYLLAFGAVYALVTLIGFIQSDTVAGIIPVNGADNVLHLVIAAASLALGLTLSDQPRSPRTTGRARPLDAPASR